MCTVSVVPHAAGVRVICNRDERPERSEALPPARRARPGGGWVMHPIDPAGGGTWIGVNDDGLVLTLLNQSSPRVTGGPRPSRGILIPRFLALGGLPAVVQALARFDPAPFAPFRLLALQGSEAFVASRVGRHIACEARAVTDPLLVTSSSLGDDLADAHRRPWFERLVCETTDRLAGQRRFHDSPWTADRRFGVFLNRPGARTVSRVTIDLDPSGRVTTFDYTGRRASEEAA